MQYSQSLLLAGKGVVIKVCRLPKLSDKKNIHLPQKKIIGILTNILHSEELENSIFIVSKVKYVEYIVEHHTVCMTEL